MLQSKSFSSTIKNINTEAGVTTLMYHRFEENKYPSTNIKKEVFLSHLKEIKDSRIKFITFKDFEKKVRNKIDNKYLLLTIDDAFSSFYIHAWPILKKDKIPFILFVSTREIGKHGYMNWEQIKEVASHDGVTIGNHSHSHEYLIDWKDSKIRSDIKKSIEIFKEKLGYSPKIFSYPFGEYSNNLKNIISDLDFDFAFGQHSGVIDVSKDFLELPRFPINEKYGDLKRFKSIIRTLPLPFENITPENRYLQNNENPPVVKIKFFDNLINFKNINCYSNEGNIWRKSDIKFSATNEITILLKDKFKSERGRINCSIWHKSKNWRWLGIQYVIAEY